MELLMKSGKITTFNRELSGCTILCRSGALWITQEGDFRDHILRPGCRMNVETKGRVVICASGAASFSVDRASVARRSPLSIIPALCR